MIHDLLVQPHSGFVPHSSRHAPLMGCGVLVFDKPCILGPVPIGEAGRRAHWPRQPALAGRLARNKALFTLPRLSFGSLVNI